MVGVPMLKGSQKKLGSSHNSHLEEGTKNDHTNDKANDKTNDKTNGRCKIGLSKDGSEKKLLRDDNNCVQADRSKIIGIGPNDKTNNENRKWSNLKKERNEKKSFFTVFVVIRARQRRWVRLLRL